MYVATIPNRSSPPAILLRSSYREGKKVNTRTLANITHWPEAKVEALRRVLRGDTLVSPDDAFEIRRSLPHGHVLAVLGTLRRVGLHQIIGARPSHERNLSVAMIVARVIEPGSKLATARGLADETAFSSLAEELDIVSATEDELYEAMDWLLPRQQRIEDTLAKRHLRGGIIALYDLTSTYFEGVTCPLAKLGHDRDGKKGKVQIVIGLLCNLEGCPVAIEVFAGNTGDPKTLASQIHKVRVRFGLEYVIMVGDRGMITEARIREEFKGVEGLEWITALRAPAIKKLMQAGAIQMTFFDEKDLGEITHPDYPGERLVVCRNPILAAQRTRKREELLQATERKLEKIRQATRRKRNRLTGKDNIALRVGRDIGKHKMKKHFCIKITDDSFDFERDTESIANEAAIDGIYIIRTSVKPEILNEEKIVGVYKRLSVVERAFRSIKSVDLKIRPVHHRLEDRVRSHAFLCMLAYYVEWHMRQALAPILFDDHEKALAEELRTSVVAPAARSPAAEAKARKKETEDGLPVHSFQTFLKDLRTLTKNHMRAKIPGSPEFIQYATPTRLQREALSLLNLPVPRP
jgi:hypothetical protein